MGILQRFFGGKPPAKDDWWAAAYYSKSEIQEEDIIVANKKQSATSFLTVSGRMIDVTQFSEKDVSAWDIAWSLHYSLRYNGHTPVAWDVLSHTGLAYQTALLTEKEPLSNIDQLGLLLHDAAEYAIGDIIRPVKVQFPGFKKLEESVLRQIFTRFNANYDDVNWELVEKYDNEALWTEQYLLGRVSDKYYGNPSYHPKVRKLIKVKCVDYIALLKHLAINFHASNITELFNIPPVLVPYIGANNDPSVETIQSVKTTTSLNNDEEFVAGNVNKTTIVKGPELTNEDEFKPGSRNNSVEFLTA